MKETYQIHTSYGTYGIIVKDKHVVKAAKIANWMVGLPIERIIAWVRGKKGTISLIERTRDAK